jgi:hypothetical protein
LTNVPFGTGYFIRTRSSGLLFADVAAVNVPNITPVTVNVKSGGATITGTIATPPAQGVAVELRDATGVVTLGATIASAGTYTFNNVAGGNTTYTLVPQVVVGHFTNPASVQVTVVTDPSLVSAPTMTYN